MHVSPDERHGLPIEALDLSTIDVSQAVTTAGDRDELVWHAPPG
jgi:hypothetical protein